VILFASGSGLDSLHFFFIVRVGSILTNRGPMSSLLVCTQPATGNPGALVPWDVPALLQRLSAEPQLSRVSQASRLELRPAPDTVSSGISTLDDLTGGFPRGSLTEVYGPPSSGCTSLLLAGLVVATRRHEACALVDVSNAFDPHCAATTGMDLQQLLWVRCNGMNTKNGHKHSPTTTGACLLKKFEFKSHMARLTQALKATDLLLQSGGFGLVAIDLSGIPHAAARRIPLASWFRFRRAVENTPTVLLVSGHGSCAKACASLVLRLEKKSWEKISALRCQVSAAEEITLNKYVTAHNFPRPNEFSGGPPAHARLLKGISVVVEVERSRFNRKPPQSDKTGFATTTAWCG